MRYKSHQVVSCQQTDQANQDLNQNQPVANLKLSLLIIVLALILIGSFLRYQQYQQMMYEQRFQPHKQDMMQSEAAKTLQQQGQHNQRIKQKDNLQLLFQIQSDQQQIQQSQSLLIRGGIQDQKINTYDEYDSIFSNEQQTIEKALKDSKAIYSFPVLAELKIPEQNKKVTAIFTTSSSRQNFLQQTLASFFKYNSFSSGLEKVIVVNDGPQELELKKLKEKYPTITWIITHQKVDQVKAIDLAYSQVKTPFVFHSSDGWIFLRPSFIEVGFDYFERIYNLLQFLISNTNQKVNPQARIFESNAFEFGFYPGLIKMQYYQMFKKMYQSQQKHPSQKLRIDQAQRLIQESNKMKGLLIVQTQVSFAKQIQ